MLTLLASLCNERLHCGNFVDLLWVVPLGVVIMYCTSSSIIRSVGSPSVSPMHAYR